MQKLFFGLSGRAILSFLVSLLFCIYVVETTIANQENLRKLQAEQIVMERSLRIGEVITGLMDKVNALALMVIHRHGGTETFEEIASFVVDSDPVIAHAIVAPDGIITKVYPLAGNEHLLGRSFFDDSRPGNREAIAARDTGAMVLGGPFKSARGGQSLGGRMPVYIDTPTQNQQFWGLVALGLKFPDVLESAELELLGNNDIFYELWRISPDTGERQVMAHNLSAAESDYTFTTKEIKILNATWYLSVSQHRPWYSYRENVMMVIGGILISFLMVFLMQSQFELQKVKTRFDKIARTDPVTEIFNKRYLEESLKRVINSLPRSNGTLSVLMADVDMFKNYNGIYGHAKADACLKTIAEVLSENLLRADDFAARFDGDGFVVVLPNTSKNGARIVAQKLVESIRERNIEFKNGHTTGRVTISIGVTTGLVEYCHNGDDYIRQAEKAMYISKQNGRDRYTFLDL